VGVLAYTVSTALAKVSISVFLLRIVVTNVYKRIIYFIIAINFYSIIYFFFYLNQCKPISFFWNKNQPGHCVNPNFIVYVAYAFTAVSMVTDFTFGILPIFLVRKLNMNRKTKVAIAGLLGMAALLVLPSHVYYQFHVNTHLPSASAATIVRIPSLINFNNPEYFLSKHPTHFPSLDYGG
jgi:hypothetical protein